MNEIKISHHRQSGRHYCLNEKECKIPRNILHAVCPELWVIGIFMRRLYN